MHKIRVVKTDLFRDTIFMFFLKVSSAILGIASNIIFARILSMEEYGVFVQLIASVTILATIIAIGSPSLLTREVASYKAHESWELLKGLVIWSSKRLLFSGLVSVVLCLLIMVLYVPKYLQLSGLLVLLLILISVINQIRAAILRGLHSVIAADLPDQVLQPSIILLTLGVSFWISSINKDVSFCLLASLLGSIFSLIIGLLFLYKAWPPITKATKIKVDIDLWNKSSKIFFMISVLSIVDSQIVTLLVGYFSDAISAGIFQACTRLVVLVVFGLVIVNTTILPRIASAWSQKDIIYMQYLVTYAAKNGSYFAIISCAPLLVFPEWFLGLFGSGYESGSMALRILLIGQLVNTISGPCGIILTMTGHQIFAFKALALSVLVSITSNTLLIPRLGLTGAAISVATSMIIWNLLMVYWVKKKTGILSTAFIRLKQ